MSKYLINFIKQKKLPHSQLFNKFDLIMNILYNNICVYDYIKD